MGRRLSVRPDKDFVAQVIERGADSVKKCFQCSTCTVVCPVSPADNPFPRKEMIWAQWGLADRIVKDPDIWVCQGCSDCNARCPRDAHPANVMAVLREYVIGVCAAPKPIVRAFGSPWYLPLLLVIPALLFILWLWLWGDLHNPNSFHTESGQIILSEFIKDSHADYGLFILFGFVLVALAIGIRRLWKGLMSTEAGKSRTGLTLFQSFALAVYEIIKHANFLRCKGCSKRVYYAHLGIFYGCLALLAATGITFLLHYADKWLDLSYQWESPWGIFSPTKAFGLIGSVLLTGGLLIAIARRLSKDPGVGRTTYGDWSLLIMLLLTVWSGIATWLIRVMEWEAGTYWAYMIHAVFLFELFLYAPFTKGAHIFYRLTARTWSYYTGRGL